MSDTVGESNLPTGTNVLPNGHIAVASTDAGMLTFAALDGSVHIHLLRYDGSLECLGIAEPERTDVWMKRLYAVRKVAANELTSGDDGA